MSSDPRKRALELARRRAQQRQNLTAEKDRKEIEKDQREKDERENKDKQESYLEKVRLRDEEKKQQERDLLQKEMDILKQKQKLVKEQEKLKKEKEEAEKIEEIKKLEREKILRELKINQEEVEKEKKLKNELLERKVEERKFREQELLAKKSTLQENFTINENLNIQSKILEISDKKIYRETSKKNELYAPDFNLERDIKLNPPNEHIKLPVLLTNTVDYVERKQKELLALKNSNNITYFIKKNKKDLHSLYSIWNSEAKVSKKIITKVEEEINSSTLSKEFHQRIQDSAFFWLPQSNFDQFYSTIVALASKSVVYEPKSLQIIIDLTEDEILNSLVDGIHWKLVCPIFQDQELPIYEESLSKQSLKWKKKLPEPYHHIIGFQIANFYEKLDGLNAIKNYLQIKFLEVDIIRDFLHGIGTRSDSYPINSMMFEHSLKKLFMDKSKEELSNFLQIIINIAETFGFLQVSDSQRYKSGSSKFISLTSYGKQKINNFQKDLRNMAEIHNKSSSVKGYYKDYACSNCGYSMMTDFAICPHCGEIKIITCKNCKKDISYQWELCPFCGLVRNHL